jgi:hypothetical protein
MKTIFIGLVSFLFLLSANLYATPPLIIDKVSFKLLYQKDQYLLKTPSGNKILLQKNWLMPPDQLEEDEMSYVTSFNYNNDIHSFPISENIVGLHISSYAIQNRGSANAAAGRDLFFIFDTNSMKLTPGKIYLNITKHRVRSMGCFWANFSNFYIYDINNDGFTDLGIITEKIWCEHENDQRAERESISGPFYHKQSIKWYIFQLTSWQYNTKLNQNNPDNLIKLPLIGLSKSPVEFLIEILGNRITYK